MQVKDAMTKDVLTVGPETPVHDIAVLLADKRISGVPVVTEAGELVGVVTETDLLHRAEIGTEKKRKWWLRMIADSNQLARDFSRSHGQQARDVMARYVISTSEETSLADAADIMESQRVKRLPVVRDGKLVGIISRGDLVRVLARSEVTRSTAKLDNATVYKALHERMMQQAWLNTSVINVSVNDGVASLSGFVESADQRTALRVLAEHTAGVTKVEDNLRVGMPRMGGV